ncbi:MAG TPA: hypothetical protein VNX28_06855, partial [Gemmataceae bacterium]|nr:hypothetical protein [Gemmataceae bacterium]
PSGDADFRMTVYPASGPLLQEFVHLGGPPMPPGPTAAMPDVELTRLRTERDGLEEQVKQLKDDLRKEGARADRLQDLVRILEARLKIAPSRSRAEDRK